MSLADDVASVHVLLRRDDALALALRGEPDVVSAPVVQREIMELLDAARGCRELTIDMSGVTFCGSTGINMLLRVQLVAERRGVTTRLAGASPMLRRTITVLGLDERLPTDENPGGA